MAIPKLALIPASQGTKLYSVLPANGVGDFAFTRGSSATRINSQGLIETVASGISRLNYPLIDGVVNGCPSHLLEPTRSNDLQKSQEFNDSYWTKYQSSVLDNLSISPDGSLNADKLIEDNSSATHQLGRAINYVSGTTYTVSIFAKSSNRNLEISAGNTNTFPAKAIFDLSNGIVLSTTFGNASIKYFGNGWYRCVISSTAASTSTTNINFGIVNGYALSYNGDGSSFLELFGVSREIGSYATSYISTNGSAVTRSAETANDAGDASTFNDSEGVLFAEIADIKNDDGVEKRLSIQDGGTFDAVRITFTPTTNSITGVVYNNGATQCNLVHVVSNTENFNKIALKYKANDFALWINGIEVATDNSGTVFNNGALDKLSFDLFNNAKVYGSTKQIQYFDSALNDSDLETLTSWTSFTDMANGQQYSIK